MCGNYSVSASVLPVIRRSLLVLSLMYAGACGGEGSGPAGPTQPPTRPPTPPTVQLNPLPDHTNKASFSLSGSTTAGSKVTVSGGTTPATATAGATGAFTVAVPLNANQKNTLSVTAVSPAGLSSSVTTVTLTHDGVIPHLTIRYPSDSIFDTDGDFRVNFAFSYGDSIGGVEVITVTNDRDIGGGTDIGGVTAGSNLLTADGASPLLDADSVTYNASIDHEFPVGTNTLIVSVADSAGNVQADTVEFEVFGTEPSFSMIMPSDGDTLPSPGFVISSEFSDIAGRILQSGLLFIADRPLIGLLSQDGTQLEGASAGQSFGHAFNFTDTIAELVDNGSYAFTGGETTIIGSVLDMAGNASQADTITVTFPVLPHSLFVVNSTAQPGATDHNISIGFTSFEAFSGAQFSLEFDPSVLTVDSVSSAGRVPSSAFYEITDDGQVDIVLVDLAGEPIPLGSGVVVNMHSSVSAEAQTQDLALTIKNVQIANDIGNPVTVVVRDGFLEIRR